MISHKIANVKQKKHQEDAGFFNECIEKTLTTALRSVKLLGHSSVCPFGAVVRWHHCNGGTDGRDLKRNRPFPGQSVCVSAATKPHHGESVINEYSVVIINDESTIKRSRHSDASEP